MAQTDYQNATFDPTVLNASQQDLLINALNSNKPGAGSNSRSNTLNNNQSVNPTEFVSPLDQIPSSGNVYDSTPFLDYEVDDTNFDWDVNGQLIGDLPGGADANEDEEEETQGKRKNPDDDDEEGSGKRRESEPSGNKKPGRKPLTSEPTSKRKAQNRAAQRAFRERKEKHLKDLESKVEDLEKASEAANHENGLLRAQVERLQTELREYRKRLSVGPVGARTSPQSNSTGRSSKSSWDINNNFQFAFPKFGPFGDTSSTTPNPSATIRTSSNAAFSRPGSTSNRSPGTAGQSNASGSPVTNFPNTSVDELRGLFSPSILASVNSNGDTDYVNFRGQNQTTQNSPAAGSMVSKKSAERTYSDANSNSPASSANNGFTSSCVTTPEYSADSPETRKAGEAAFNSIAVDGQRRKSSTQEAFCKEFATACGNKENPVPPMMSDSDITPASTATTAMQPHTPSLDNQGFDWFASQNGGVFDPVLFGDYRDPQENIMSGDFGFFNDAFTMPDVSGDSTVNPLETALPKKRDLMKEIEENQAGKEPEVVPGEHPKQFLTCNMLWDRVQRSHRVQSGEADMDDLCSQLKAKAKCSGNGAVIDQKDVDAILGPLPDEPKDVFKLFK